MREDINKGISNNEYIQNENKNIIEGELYIRLEEINNNIALFKTEIND